MGVQSGEHLLRSAEAWMSHSGRGRDWFQDLGLPVPMGTVLGEFHASTH